MSRNLEAASLYSLANRQDMARPKFSFARILDKNGYAGELEREVKAAGAKVRMPYIFGGAAFRTPKMLFSSRCGD